MVFVVINCVSSEGTDKDISAAEVVFIHSKFHHPLARVAYQRPKS